MTETARTIISVPISPGTAIGDPQFGRRVRCRLDPYRTAVEPRHAKGRNSGRWLYDDHEQRRNTRQSQLRFR
jgi:hypothetical protein